MTGLYGWLLNQGNSWSSRISIYSVLRKVDRELYFPSWSVWWVKALFQVTFFTWMAVLEKFDSRQISQTKLNYVNPMSWAKEVGLISTTILSIWLLDRRNNLRQWNKQSVAQFEENKMSVHSVFKSKAHSSRIFHETNGRKSSKSCSRLVCQVRVIRSVRND